VCTTLSQAQIPATQQVRPLRSGTSIARKQRENFRTYPQGIAVMNNIKTKKTFLKVIIYYLFTIFVNILFSK